MSNICFMCLKDTNKLESVYLNRTEDAVKQLNYVLPEITFELAIPLHICSTCQNKLHSFCTFKKQCLENYYRFTKNLRKTKDQSFYAFQTEIKYIKEQNQVDVDLINEAPEELDSQTNFITKKDTMKAVQDETISPGLNRYTNEVSGISDDSKSFKCKELHDETNNFIEDNINYIYIKEERITFEDSEEPKLYQELVPDIKKEIDSEHDINEIKIADLNINNAERTVSSLIISSDFNKKINEECEIKKKIKSFECKICNKEFTQRSKLKSHIKIHSGNKNFLCSICEKKFTQRSHLNDHMKTHIGIKDFQCSICEQKFSQRGNLNVHMKTHTGVKDFQCSICEKKFTQNSLMKRHMKIHTGVKDFKCSICEKRFTQNSSLKLHMKAHTGVKDFQCSICERKFMLKFNLNVHMKTHTGIKDFQCSICEKKFTQRKNLDDHMKVHSGIKDFQCSICEKKFMLKFNLNVHMKTHTGMKDFQCSICEKKFTQRSHLNDHMKTHIGIKDFQCSVCEKKFIRNSHLKRHMQTHSRI